MDDRENDPVDRIIWTILEHEGGYVDDPDDPGGATNHGISLRYARGIGLDLNGDGETDADDIQLVTPSLAAKLFRADFLESPRINALPEPLWPVLFDWAVNSGPPRAIMGLQDVLNRARLQIAPLFTKYGPLDQDGRIGKRTRFAAEAANAVLGLYLINAIVETRLAFYRRLVDINPSKAKFLRGWTARANSFRVEAA